MQNGSLSANRWERAETSGLPLHTAVSFRTLPGVAQGFTTRLGGGGLAPYDTLNLSLNCGDDPHVVLENRARLAAALGFPTEQWALTEQVHGCSVAVIDQTPAAGAPLPCVDGLITAVPGVLLALRFADCVPVYLYDPVKKVAALLHSG